MDLLLGSVFVVRALNFLDSVSQKCPDLSCHISSMKDTHSPPSFLVSIVMLLITS